MSKSSTAPAPAKQGAGRNGRIPHVEPLFEDAQFVENYSRAAEEFAIPEYGRLLQFVLDGLQDHEAPKVLEIGPGPGWVGIHLAKQHPTMHVTGVDVSDEYVRIANENSVRAEVADRVTFLKGDARQMDDLADASFDAVVSNQSYHYWEPPREVLNEMVRVLKPGGLFCIGCDRRDRTLRARFAVWLAKWHLARSVHECWMRAFKGCYTIREVEEQLDDSDLKDHRDTWEMIVLPRMFYLQGRIG
jgi:ubiquinone/menaquinone biosynthesis C-methylase UbiE